MTLRQRQSKFAGMVARLIVHAESLGYEITLSYCLRCEDCKVGHENSLHKLKLAIDIDLFKDGEYLQTTEAHEPLGLYWESLGGTWGGRFSDGNHYSLKYKGMS
jgi:hypothetical protein